MPSQEKQISVDVSNENKVKKKLCWPITAILTGVSAVCAE